jgi:starvation-inducible outer membrane lipoprotein
MFKVSKLLAPAIILTLVSACDNAKQAEQQTAQATPAAHATMPANHPSINQAPQQAGLGNLQGGIIKEILSGGGYTYVLVEHEGVQLWAAGPQSTLAVGTLVGWYESTVMRNFNSKSLNRNFAEIHFISAFIDPAKATQTMQTRQPQANAPQQSAATMGGVITEVLNSGGYTYVNVNNQGQDMWAAGPMMKLEKGETVTWSGGSKMTNFKSSSLGKTFAEVYFVGGFNKGGTVSANVQTSAQPQLNQGVVKQIISSAGYTYIEVQSTEKTLWLAAPETTVKAEDKISWANGSVMHNFQSRSLDRVFTEIVFVDSINVAS